MSDDVKLEKLYKALFVTLRNLNRATRSVDDTIRDFHYFILDSRERIRQEEREEYEIQMELSEREEPRGWVV